MKKKIMAVLICSMLSVSLLAGCGKDEEEAAEATEVVTEVEETTEEEVADMCSDEDFKTLQDAYAALADEYNAIADYYVNNDDIAKDEDMESLLGQAKDYMDMVGEIQQNELAAADASELAQSMITVEEGLVKAAEALDIMAENGAAAAAECSEESFAALQETYGYLVEEYNTIVEEYQNNDAVPQNSDLEGYLDEAKALIEEIGSVEQNTISEADAVSLAESMTTLANSMAEVAAEVFK